MGRKSINLEHERGASFSLALASFVSIAALLTFFSLTVKTAAQLRDRSAYCYFTNALAISDYKNSQRYLKKLFTPPRLFLWFQREPDYMAGMTRGAKYAILDELFEVMTFLGLDSFDKAVLRFNALRNDRLRKLLYVIPPDRRLAALLGEIEKGFASYHKQLNKLKKKEIEVPEVVAANEQRIVQAKSWALDLASELASFLSLPSDFDRRKDATFYHSGVLAGLPTLPQLPDDIPDLIAMKQLLQQMGGEVKIRGANAPLRFQEKLNSFQKSASLFSSEIETLSSENQRLEKELSTLKVQAFEQGKALQSQLATFITTASMPEVSSFTEKIYGTLPGRDRCRSGTLNQR